jgi:hypothetical protein
MISSVCVGQSVCACAMNRCRNATLSIQTLSKNAEGPLRAIADNALQFMQKQKYNTNLLASENRAQNRDGVCNSCRELAPSGVKARECYICRLQQSHHNIPTQNESLARPRTGSSMSTPPNGRYQQHDKGVSK